MLRFVMSFLGGVFSMLTLGLAMGAVTLGAVFYMYGRDLPSIEVLQQYTPRTISRVYSGEGRIIDEFATERRLFTPSEEIPDLVKHAFVSAEDQNFYTHPGFDIRGMAAAAVEAVRSRGHDMRGASTITQQVMKNFLLSADRTAERKIKELILAVRIERAMSKEDILELYLNEIFLGQNSYGITAAAQTYFNKPLTDLTPGEAAYLAALAQRPGNLHPVRDYDDAVARRNYVLRRMAEDGYIDQQTAEVEAGLPLRSVQSGDYESFRAELPPRDYFTDEIRRQLSESFGDEQFASGGYAIRATVDPELQLDAGPRAPTGAGELRPGAGEMARGRDQAAAGVAGRRGDLAAGSGRHRRSARHHAGRPVVPGRGAGDRRPADAARDRGGARGGPGGAPVGHRLDPRQLRRQLRRGRRGAGPREDGG
ncbi:Penicillin-binding protein 1A [Rubellimicrobium mesophilum DSM 19309]|uniref:Penicillin-binding protein 1A n=1 Tax=Rubellimicrobium mesophilum DSM 19309 TaxID=442562 RepID=A0A017HNQ2_9RHOB|nr:Penicillin-binding protein 1A [Rubellimicrobium mesophilum DSM 19309]